MHACVCVCVCVRLCVHGVCSWLPCTYQCQCVHVVCVTTCMFGASLLSPALHPCAGGTRLSVYCTGGAVAAGAWGESGGQTGGRD